MKSLDHAVEGEPVVEALGGELAEVLDRLGRVLVEQLEDDRALGGVHRGGGHRCAPLLGSWSARRIAAWRARRRARERSALVAARSRRRERLDHAVGLAGGDATGTRSGRAPCTSRTASPSSPVAEVTAPTMSATRIPAARPPPSTQLRVGLVAVALRRAAWSGGAGARVTGVGRRRRARLPRRDRRADVALDRLQLALLAVLDERDRPARAPDAPGAPDAVHVGVRARSARRS